MSKKRDSANGTALRTKKEVVPPLSDSELFVQAFEKPTQIYRYLRSRRITSPSFMHRNLSYMKNRRSHNNANRKTFKIDTILGRLESAKVAKPFEKITNSENLIISFAYFSDTDLQSKYVKVETILEKISNKRRKEGPSAQNQIRIGESSVLVNPDDNEIDKIPAVCISAAEFDRLGENLLTTFQLTFNVETMSTINSITNTANGDEPPRKQICTNKQYRAELPVFNQNGQNLLLNGQYEVIATPKPFYNSFNKVTTWESIPDNTTMCKYIKGLENNNDLFNINPFDTFCKQPKIFVIFDWSKGKLPTSGYLARPKILVDNTFALINNNNNKENNSQYNIQHQNGNNTEANNELDELNQSKKSFMFQFIFNNSTKQQTEERSDYICPWCSINCIRIYSLMKHLRLCHARLLFSYVEDGDIRRIDVSINDMYDGSYSGAPHDVLFGLSRYGPTRRSVVTNIMVFRPRRPTFKMAEFNEIDDSDMDQQRQYISGHNRIYYHSETCIPIMPKELDYDSEGESDPKWLQRTTKQMIDEFTDVNEGEKELMKMWNLHVMKYGFVGDCQISLACDLFIENNGIELLERNLYRNFVIHMTSLFNYGLISPETIYNNMQKLNKMKNDNATLIDAAKKARLEQVNYWTTFGIEKENAKKQEELLTAATASTSTVTTPARTSTPNKHGIDSSSNLVSSSSKSTNNPNTKSTSHTTPIKSKILNKSNSSSNLLKNSPIQTSLKNALKRKLSGGN
ncbi:unnamed protein product [Diamesa tonsa]